MMKKFKHIHLFLLVIGFYSCDKLLLDEEIPDNPVSNFEVLWNEYDSKYGLFEVKQINWDSIYTEYRSQILEGSTEEELYTVLTNMLSVLNDNHVGLAPLSGSGLPFYQSGILGRMDTITDFDLEMLINNYFTEIKFEAPFFSYGIADGNIGYLHIEGFSDMPRNLKKPMGIILDYLNDTEAMIIDVRGGFGGEDLAGQYIAGCFTDESATYMKVRVKNGPGKNDFTKYEDWEVRPEGDFQYTKPIVVLTHRFTISARETFCLAMRKLPHVTFMGDTTSGAFSNQINRELPNGWGYSISIGQWVNAEGESYEGIGLAPEIVVQNIKQDILSGRDEAFERAIDQLKKVK